MKIGKPVLNILFLATMLTLVAEMGLYRSCLIILLVMSFNAIAVIELMKFLSDKIDEQN